MPISAGIKRLLFEPALAAGLTLLLASAASAAPPAAGFFFGFPDQPRLEDSDAAPSRAAKPHRKPHREAKRHEAKRDEDKANRHENKATREHSPPQGPFQIVVAIAQQQVTLYGQNGAIDRAPISTGMPDHPTPMGVFTVLSKHKWHQSNIYSGAPMPYMQRITWSGIAMHAGPRPGFPASHGCIRLPEDFAIRLWGTTKVGARVIVTREPVAPVEIANPKLFVAKKPEEKAAAADRAAEPTKAAISFAADPPAAAKPAAGTATADAAGNVAVTPIEAKPASEPPRPQGPISVFVSLKQNRVFVRQGFVPLLDLAVAIAEPDRPIGTHVFTAMALKDDGAAMRWTVMSIPSGYRHHAGKRAKKTSHDRRQTPAAEQAPPAASTAAEALDRITLPPEAIERISALLSPGASLIVSDNALSDETDADTDIIVLTP